MKELIPFILGFIVGVFFGLFVFAVLHASKAGDGNDTLPETEIGDDNA